MIKQIDLKFASNTIVILNTLLLIYHLLIINQIIPYDIVWGGKLKTLSQMYQFEITSILINIFILVIILIKSKAIKLRINSYLINILLWIFVIIFSINTINNLIAKNIIETLIFTPVTLILAIGCARLALEKK